MLVTIAQTVLPALVLFTTLFGVMARGDPKPGGVALFFRVGIAGLLLGGVLWFVVHRTALLPGTPAFLVDMTRGFVGGGVFLLLMAAFGTALKRRQ